MRLLMNVSKNRHGTYYAVKKVPKRLEHAVAQALGGTKARQSWLKRSLDTKNLREANERAKPVLIEFGNTLKRAEALLAERPVRTSLSPIEIKRMAEYYYATKLASHDEYVLTAPEQEAEFRKLEPDAGPWVEPIPEFGLSGGQMFDERENLPPLIREAEAALAKGDVTHADFQIEQTLNAFQINLDRKSAAYQKLGIAILRAFVRYLRAIQQRSAGEPIETPPLPAVGTTLTPTGETLTAAFEGWKRSGNRSGRTLQDFQHAIKLFVELHGDMRVAQIRRSHAREFVKALRDVPVRHLRTGKLRNATLPELAQWGREHPEAQKIAASTINKLLGGVQAVGRWARSEDLVPDAWADPFADIRIDEDESERAPFETDELQVIFNTPVFTEGERPEGGRGEAAFWLPLLALFTGARLGELSGLRASDVVHDQAIGAISLHITADRKAGKKLKTRQSARVVPVHEQLIELGFLKFVASEAKARGEGAWLFPQVAPGTTGAAAFSKWFGRYIGTHGVNDAAKVFHSFRHNFTDALRLAAVSEDVSRALVGHTQGGVHGRYGAKEMAARYRHRLAEAVASVKYPGLDLSRLTNHRTPKGECGAPEMIGRKELK